MSVCKTPIRDDLKQCQRWPRGQLLLRNEFIFYQFSRFVQCLTFLSWSVMPASSSHWKYKTLPAVVRVLQTTQNLVISRCCFAEDDCKRLYWQTCKTVLLIHLKLFLATSSFCVVTCLNSLFAQFGVQGFRYRQIDAYLWLICSSSSRTKMKMATVMHAMDQKRTSKKSLLTIRQRTLVSCWLL